jgi:uncharacterized protein DUF6364
MTKLTLSVDKAVVEQAKRIAEANGTSVSAMFSQFVEAMAQGKRAGIRPGRIARQASGLVKLPSSKADKELLAEALATHFAD